MDNSFYLLGIRNEKLLKKYIFKYSIDYYKLMQNGKKMKLVVFENSEGFKLSNADIREIPPFIRVTELFID